jgi:hypothetical protein
VDWLRPNVLGVLGKHIGLSELRFGVACSNSSWPSCARQLMTQLPLLTNLHMVSMTLASAPHLRRQISTVKEEDIHPDDRDSSADLDIEWKHDAITHMELVLPSDDDNGEEWLAIPPLTLPSLIAYGGTLSATQFAHVLQNSPLLTEFGGSIANPKTKEEETCRIIDDVLKQGFAKNLEGFALNHPRPLPIPILQSLASYCPKLQEVASRWKMIYSLPLTEFCCVLFYLVISIGNDYCTRQ